MPEGAPLKDVNGVVYYVLQYNATSEQRIHMLEKVSKATRFILPYWKGNTEKFFKLHPFSNEHRFTAMRMAPFSEYVYVKSNAGAMKWRQREFVMPEDLNRKPWLNQRVVEFPADQWINLPQGIV